MPRGGAPHGRHGVRISMGNKSYRIEDASLEDLRSLLDEVEDLTQG